MAIISLAHLPLPGQGKFANASFEGRYEFGMLTRRVEQSVHLIEQPLAYARVLQRLRQPTWYMEYRDNPATRAFRQGMTEAVVRLGAKLVYHSHFQRCDPDPTSIALRWHSYSKRDRVIHYKEAYLPHMTHFDREGYSGWSEVAGDKKSLKDEYPEAQVADDFFTNDIQPFLAQKKSKYNQSDEPFEQPPGYVFVAMQLINDAVIALKYEDRYLKSMNDFIRFLAKKGMKVIIKRHPHCRAAEVADFIRKLAEDGAAVETKASIHSIIPGAQAVVTLNSGVGFESLLYEKPVVCLGKADYGEMVFQLRDTQTGEAEMEKALAFIARGEAPKALRQHLFVMLKKYQVDSRDEIAFDRAVLRALCLHHLDHQMVL